MVKANTSFYLLSFLFLFLFLSNSFASKYISEINFKDEEFLEIYSDEILNFSNAKIFGQDNNTSHFNTLSLYQKTNSSFYLIIGSKFYDKYRNIYNFSNLNCSMYLTDKTQVVYGGLSSTGEDITIQLNSSENISYKNEKVFNFLANESLNFDKNTSKYFVSQFSICDFPKYYVNNVSELENDTNNSVETCSSDFEIIPYEDIFSNTIKYKFITNLSVNANFTISYWIEDYSGNIVKSKIDTKNTNQKQYSPKGMTNIYVIKANLYYENCTKFASKIVYFFSNQECPSSSCDCSSSSSSSDDEKSKGSYIKITNKEDVLNGSDILKYEIYKGETAKRVVYFYLNKNKIMSLYLDKYSKITGAFPLFSLHNKNNFTLSGLEKSSTIIFFRSEFDNNSLNESFASDEVPKITKTSKFSLSDFLVSHNLINFDLTYPINSQPICYLLYKRTKVSPVLNISNQTKQQTHFNLSIHNEILKEKNISQIYLLKLLCKYMPENSKYYKYSTFVFNYTISSDFYEKNLDINVLNLNLLEKNQNLNKNTILFQKNLIFSSPDKKIQSEVYVSQNYTSKKYSLYLFLSILVFLLSIFVVIW